jgi:type III pantothenate kinase
MPEKTKTSVVAIDIGSSRTHAGVVDVGRLTCLCRRDFPSQDMIRKLPETLSRMKKEAGCAAPLPAVIAGGAGSPAKTAEKILASRGARPVLHLACSSSLPVAFAYKNPSRLGADRIADALYAAARYPGRACIIIDAGTCITVDVVTASAKFLGGVIMPGVATQLHGMKAAAPALPTVAVTEARMPLPATSTAACMQAGALFGSAGGLNLLVKNYQEITGKKCVILATGGGWKGIKKLVDFKYIEVPDMTIVGTGLFYRYAS